MSISFSALGVRAELVACLAELGILDPYPIQSATLADALAGRDLFAQSPTGSGKTLAFAIPLVTRIGTAQPRRPRGLVLAPTRELAAQIAEAAQPLAQILGRSVATFYGGVGYKEQLTALRRGVDIAVGCPGRLNDLLERNALDLSGVEVVVVDEADRMADMGFLPAVRRLLEEIRGAHQTMLFSATRTSDVERLVRDFQRSPRRHFLELASHEVGTRTHELWRAGKHERVELTTRLVTRFSSSIVFCRTKRGADRLARQLSKSGVVAVAIHGDRSQAQRDRALAHFRERKARVLVGTDVASRGIHVDGVDCVVHFDPPADDDTYVHRSGRTGRAGATGLVVLLVAPDEEQEALRMHRRLGIDAGLGAPLGAEGNVREPTVRTSQRPLSGHVERGTDAPRPKGADRVATGRARRAARQRRGGTRGRAGAGSGAPMPRAHGGRAH